MKSDRKTIRFQQLTLLRAPGFPGGMPPLRDLQAPIVIVCGANGSGKSTTARVLQEVLSPDKHSQTEFECAFEVDGQLWALRKTSIGHRWTCNGDETHPDFLPASTQQSLYMLAMHDLLQSEDGDLAKAIYEASIGGFNIEQAAKSLNYAGVGKNSKSAEFQRYQELEKASTTVKETHRQVKARQASLSTLEKKKEEGSAAREHLTYYTHLKQWYTQKQEYSRALTELNAYPQNIEHIREGDFERYRSIQRRIDELRQYINQTQYHIKTLEQECDVLGDVQSVQVEGDFRLLKQLRDTYETRVTEQDRLQEQIQAKKSEIESLKRYVGDVKLGDTRPDTVELDKRYRKCLSSEEHVALLKSSMAHYESDLSDESVYSVEELTEGIVSLSAWLREPAGAGRRSTTIWYWALAGLALLSGIAGWQVGLPALGIALVALVLAWMAIRKEQTHAPAEPGEHRRQDYQKTKLPQPSQWSVNEVTALLSQLYGDLQATSHRQKKQEKLLDVRNALTHAMAQASSDRSRLHELGTMYGLDTSQIQEAGSLYQFMRSYADLISASATLAGHLNAQKDAQEKAHQTQGAIVAILKSYARGDAYISSDHLLAAIDRLCDDMQVYIKAKAELRHKAETKERYTEDLELRIQEASNLLKRAALLPDQWHVLGELEAKRSEYLKAKEHFSGIERELSRLRLEITSSTVYESHPVDIEALDPAEIHRNIELYESVLAEYEDVLQQIGAINAEVSKIKAAHDLENALTRQEEARDRINVAYRTKLRSVMGNVLVNELQQELSKSSVPEVMQVAIELFSNITNGRYELMVSENGSGGFRAIDTLNRQYRSLSELSSGTRIQLLLSVRLAFLQVHERHVKYPLMADELLANSDDARADAVIDALLRVAQNGRQVFYFTAQTDEIAKWEQRASELVSTRIISLGGEILSRFPQVSKPELPKLLRVLPDVDQPLDQYLQKLDYPKFNLLRDDIGSLHLGYLVDETSLLHALLSSHIDYWSQLENLVENGNKPEYIDDDVLESMSKQVHALKEASELLRMGRPKPIGAQEIEESGAVSPSFMAQVLDLLEHTCDHDPAELINRLRNKEVSNFKSHKIDQLETFLMDGGYLSDEQPLSMDEYRQRMSLWLRQNQIPMADFDRLIERISHNFKLSSS